MVRPRRFVALAIIAELKALFVLGLGRRPTIWYVARALEHGREKVVGRKAGEGQETWMKKVWRLFL